MVLLNFEIFSIYYNEQQKRDHIITNFSKKYSEDKTLREVLKEIYLEFNKVERKNDDDWELCCDIFGVNELFWGQFFDKEFASNMDYSFSDYKDMTIRDLNKQFNISNMVIPVVLNKDKGANVGNAEGIEFFFYTNEKDIHHRRHIHCKYAETTTRIDLDTLEPIDEPFKKSKMDFTIKKIKENQKGLQNYWDTVVVKGENIKFKMKF